MIKWSKEKKRTPLKDPMQMLKSMLNEASVKPCIKSCTINENAYSCVYRHPMKRATTCLLQCLCLSDLNLVQMKTEKGLQKAV